MAVDTIGPRMAQWVNCVEASLTTPVGRALVMPGNTVIIDDCHCDGQLWVRVVSIVGVSNLSNPRMQPCLPLYQVRVGIGVARCAHVVDDNGVAPTPAEMTADAFQLYQDRADIMQAISCCIAPSFEDDNTVATLRIEDWLPGPVEGACMYGEITVTFNQVLCTPCPEEGP